MTTLMESKYLNNANLLKNRAQEILRKTDLHKILSEFGEVVFTGSFELDTMVWNDIDIQILPKNGKGIEEEKKLLAKLTGILISGFPIKKLNFIDFYIRKKPKMPEGRYVGFQYWDEENSEEWKFDIWILSEADFDRNRTFMKEMKEKLTGNLRTKAIEIKGKLTDEYGRPPQLASYNIYRALVHEGIRDEAEILNFLVKNGVKLEKPI